MTQEETRLIEMLRRVLKGMMLGEEYMPGQYEIVDLLDDVRDSIKERDAAQVKQALQFCTEFAQHTAMEEWKLSELRRESYEGTSQAYSGLVAGLDKISEDLSTGKTETKGEAEYEGG